MENGKCTECYPNQLGFWRDQPMNETIRESVTFQKHAYQYYNTLTDALTVWGEQIEGLPDVQN